MLTEKNQIQIHGIDFLKLIGFNHCWNRQRRLGLCINRPKHEVSIRVFHNQKRVERAAIIKLNS